MASEVSQKMQAQHKFSEWMSHRSAKLTKFEVQTATERADNETLSIRGLMAAQDSTKIITCPRDYQLELFEKAKTQNVIAVLDTGSGKTLIAILLLKHIIDIELEDRLNGKKPRIAFFLVDCVTLVFQQAAVLEKNLDQKIDCFCGEMGVDLWSAETWKEIFTENMAIVCTAEILYQCLMHSFITFDLINLLIFDEAHHAKKNHPYARLIKDYCVPQPPHQRPKIFGMTASPVDSKSNEVQAAKELETMLHSQIVTTSNLAVLQSVVSRPKEVILPFDQPCLPYETLLCREMRAKFGEVKIFAKYFAQAREVTSQLGEWCADQIWAMALDDEEQSKLDRKTEKAFRRGRQDHPVALLDAELLKLKEAKDLVAHWDFVALDTCINSISDKAKILLAFLDEEFTKEHPGKCILFVNQRWTARLLRELLIRQCSLNVRSDLLIGTRNGDAGDTRISLKRQLTALNMFRKGDTNCLIATSIAEEGLDIPECNLVIRFDLCSTLIQYIQSRGRARDMNSKYVHMIESGNKAHLQLFQEVKRGELKMRNFCEALPADRLLQGNGGEYDLNTAIFRDRGYRKYTDPSTKATLTYASSIMVLDNFVSRLPSTDGDTTRANYYVFRRDGNYVCEVTLPNESPIHSAIGRPRSQKAIARQSAAFEACLLLRQKDYLDANFLSIYRKILPRMRNARLALTMNRTQTYARISKPKDWDVSPDLLPKLLYITVLELEKPDNLGLPSRPLAILTRTRLPQFPAFKLNLQIDKSSNLICTSKEQCIEVNGPILKLLDNFTLRIFQDVFNKNFEANTSAMSYWLVPVVEDWKFSSGRSIIDWPTLQEVRDRPEGLKWSINTSPQRFVNRFLVDRWDGAKRYISVSLEPKLRARDPVPAGAAKHTSMENILDYSISLFKISRQKATNWHRDQPVVSAHQFLQRLDWLEDFTEEQDKVCTKAWLCLEPFLISALPVSVVTMSRMFPGIINRLESYLIALEAFEDLGLNAKPELALEALTKDSGNSDEHRAQQIHVQRGMGKNYERLEFIGDCFLKMATSISLFTKHPEDSEFEYHVSRMIMICNKNLLKTALEKDLCRYIRSVGFSRREWYPQGLTLLQGKGLAKSGDNKSEQHLADKTIADVCEAMIGAVLLSHKTSHGANKEMDMAVKAVTIFARSQDHDLQSWDEYHSLYKKPTYQTAHPSASHIDLAQQIERKHPYHFKSPRLLRSAFIHPSQPFAVENIPCYQRLEFLGDALLDMATISFLYHSNPNRDPQWLTEHKMAMVSNKFLAALSVKLGFHKHLRSIGTAIERQNREYVTELEEAEAAADGARNYWTNTSQPPKALSDVVESFVGAIFVDSEYDYREVERFFDAHVRWFFEDITIYDTFANNHPTTYLHKLLSLSFGCAEYRLMASEVESVIPGGSPTALAALMVHNEVVADGEASSTKQAKVKASSAALKLMQGMSRDEYRLTYRCDCTAKEEKDWVGKEGDGVGMVGTAI